jgi:uncharacterized membrane protein YecN with MAPEG domain
MKRICVAMCLLLSSLSAVALASESVGTDFEYRIQGDKFRLTLTHYYPAGVTLQKIRDVNVSETLPVEISDLVVSVKRVPRADGSIEVRSTGKKMGISMTTVSFCREELTDTLFSQACQLDPTNTVNKTLFVDGKASSTFVCRLQEATGPVCTTVLEGQARTLSILFKKWPAGQVAAEAAVGNIHDNGCLYSYIVYSAENGAKARGIYEASTMAKYAGDMYNDAMKNISVLRRNWRWRRPSAVKTLTIKASDRTGSYTVDVSP